MNFKRKLSLLMAIIFFANCLSVTMFAEETAGSQVRTANDDTASGQAVTVNESIASNDDIDIKFDLLNDWGSGYSAQLTITNNGNDTLEDWQLEFEFAHKIDSLWNGIIAESDNGKYVVTNEGYNQNIQPDESITIGFNGSPGSVNKYPEKYILKYKNGQTGSSQTEETYTEATTEFISENTTEGSDNSVSSKDLDFKFDLLNDWGSGYSAQISITNNSGKTLEDWQFEFEFGHKIDSLWNGNLISQENGKFIVSCPDWNKNLYSGGTVTIGFNGSPGLVNKFPENYVLSYNGGKYSSSDIEDNYIESTTESSSEETSESCEESTKAESENINTGNTEDSEKNNAFDFALFTGNINSDIALYTRNTYINGDVHSNKGFYFQGNKLEINGVCETVEKINANTSSSLDSCVSVKKENADIREMSYLAEYAYAHLIDKAEIYDNWQNFNSGNIELKNSIVYKQGKENFERNFAVQDWRTEFYHILEISKIS